MAIESQGTNTQAPWLEVTGPGPSYVLTWTHTLVAGSRRVLFVTAGGETFDSDLFPPWDVTGVTYGGQAMSLVIKEVTTENGAGLSNNSSELWILEDADMPADGLNTVIVTGVSGTGTTVRLTALVKQYQHVDQEIVADTDGTFVNSTAPSDTIGNSMDPNNADLVVSTYVSGNAGTWSVGQSQVELLDQQNPTAPTTTFGICELIGASPGPITLESTYNTTANRLTRAAASLVAWRCMNTITNMASINGVPRHDMGELNGVL